MATNCQAQHRNGALVLSNPHFALTLRTKGTLRAHQFLNRRTGKTISLGDGPEVELDLDAAEQRIPITGWRGKRADSWARGEFHRREFDDSKWGGNINPAMFWHSGESRCYWTRTHVFLPGDCEGKRLSLVLGGLGAFDFRFMRVFVNGHVLGTRRVHGFWHEPAEFDLGRLEKHLRFGLDNVIALQLAKPMRRTPWLDQCDPHHTRHLPWLFSYPGHFEQYIVVGRALRKPRLTVRRVREPGEGHLALELRSENPPLDVTVTYRWRANEPTLHKTVTVFRSDAVRRSGFGQSATKETPYGVNTNVPIRFLNVHLGRYRTNAKVTEGGQGFPVYLNKDFFISLAHPAGWAMGERGRVQLRQYPGKLLAPGELFASMETVYGVGGRPAFLEHVRLRMRRVRCGRAKPLAIFEAFGGYKIPPPNWLQDWVDEKIVLKNMAGMARFQRETGCRFDAYSIEFWNAKDGDFHEPDRRHFPRGFKNVLRRLKQLRTPLGLWFPFTASGNWGISANPVISASRASDPAYVTGKPSLCLASDPVKSLYQNAMCHHVRANGVRLLKPDGLMAVCHNPNHDHLPGLYSTEAIHNAAIEMLGAVDRECPDAFLMLYWGFRSPWWLLHGDSIFASGLCIEGANPSDTPTLYVRDSIVQGLDQAQWFCRDVPPLGKDSLGVWFSDWGWNSGIGRERWEEAFVMDLCRGSLLAQPWSDPPFLDRAGRKQMAEFIALLRAQPKCFANPRFIFGNPWKDEPYGYACSDGTRAFLAINNCTWNDHLISLERALIPLGTARGRKQSSADFQSAVSQVSNLLPVASACDTLPIGNRRYSRLEICATTRLHRRKLMLANLSHRSPQQPEGGTTRLQAAFSRGHDIYRWYPRPARLVGDTTRIALRPFEVVLLEIVPAGSKPSLPRKFPARSIPSAFAEPSQCIPLSCSVSKNATPLRVPIESEKEVRPSAPRGPKRVVLVKGRVPASQRGGTLVVAFRFRKNGSLFAANETGRFFAVRSTLETTSVVPNNCHPCTWQAWRIDVAKSHRENSVELQITAMLPKAVTIACEGHFIPK